MKFHQEIGLDVEAAFHSLALLHMQMEFDWINV